MRPLLKNVFLQTLNHKRLNRSSFSKIHKYKNVFLHFTETLKRKKLFKQQKLCYILMHKSKLLSL